MKPKLYIETTIVSYYTGRGSRDLIIAARQEETRCLWPKLLSEFETYISALVYEEASVGDANAAQKRLDAIKPFPVLDIDDESQVLAETLLGGNAIPEEYPEDAMHIAIAAINGINVLVTWNFTHINNPFKRMMIRQIVENAGYQCPEICSPDELMEAKP
ncbi:type II toxin-antitoxin system VapC family toxin [PVC group bacterium]|nr:type II toxin-antitoxin system VapC family toxin [PVC group bacterium]